MGLKSESGLGGVDLGQLHQKCHFEFTRGFVERPCRLLAGKIGQFAQDPHGPITKLVVRGLQ
ncbi:uncharacterized protein METZ01_LOCUS492216, partial [marine metagenome]